MVSSLNEKSPSPFKRLNWSNIERLKQATKSEHQNGPDNSANTKLLSASESDPNVTASESAEYRSDNEFEPNETSGVNKYGLPKVRSKRQKVPRGSPKQPKKPKKIQVHRGRRSIDDAEPTSTITIGINQVAQWLAKTDAFWNSSFYKAGGRVYGSGVSALTNLFDNVHFV